MRKLLEKRGVFSLILMASTYCAIPFCFGNWQGGLTFLSVALAICTLVYVAARRRQLGSDGPLDLGFAFWDADSFAFSIAISLIVIPFYLVELGIRKVLYPDIQFHRDKAGEPAAQNDLG